MVCSGFELYGDLAPFTYRAPEVKLLESIRCLEKTANVLVSRVSSGISSTRLPLEFVEGVAQVIGSWNSEKEQKQLPLVARLCEVSSLSPTCIASSDFFLSQLDASWSLALDEELVSSTNELMVHNSVVSVEGWGAILAEGFSNIS